MRRLSSGVVAATLIVSMLQGGIPVARASRGDAVTYLALGTSLAVGFQPGRGETEKGYADVLWRRMAERIPGLALRNVGCPGETSRSMINGRHSLCHYAAGSQLDAAVAFLQAHPGQVAFITVEVGANDLIERCLRDTFRLDRTCAADVLPRLQVRLTHVVDALAAAGPGVPIVGMTYYDPLLGLWGLVPGGRALARADQRVWTDLNTTFTTAYTDAGATVADVAATFEIDNFTDTVVVPGRGELPVNVANACRWTWFCSPRFAGDPHANAIGYRKIADTFDHELQDTAAVIERITPKQFHEAGGVEDWRVLGDGACAYFRTGSFADGARLVDAISDLAGLDAHHPDVDVRYEGVTVRLITITDDYFGLSDRDAELARQISAVARRLGASPDPTMLQTIQIAVDALVRPEVMPFWLAVLGYADRGDGDEDLLDPLGRGPNIWFQQMDEPRPQRNRIHLDVWVPHDQAEARVAAALAAGGRLVTDEYAPSWWVLADAEGNEVDVCTWQGHG